MKKKSILKNKDLMKKIIFTIFIMFIYRLGNNIFVNSVNPVFINNISGFDLFNLMTGANFDSFTIFALGLSPFITSSIIIELLSYDVVPVFTRWKKENDTKKKTTASNVCGLILAVLQAAGVTFMMDRTYSILRSADIFSYIYTIVILVSGSCMLLWLARQIDMHGIGNGSSVIIACGILYNMPELICSSFDSIVSYSDWNSFVSFGLLMLAFFTVIFFVVFIEKSERRINIQCSLGKNTTISRKTDDILPIKVNISGVIPVIFASSVMQAPVIICSLIGKTPKFMNYISLSHPVGICIYALLIIFFAHFYSHLMIDGKTINKKLSNSSSYIPSVRLGKDTEKFIDGVVSRVTVYGAVSLLVISLIPILLPKIWTVANTSLTVGGTSLIIVAGVAMEIVKQIQKEVTRKKYKKQHLIRKEG